MKPHIDLKRAADLFDEARAVRKEERETFLRTACAGDQELLDELLQLFARYEEDDEFLESADRRHVPERIGPYRILEEIGEGGMGTVYLAEQRDPLQRRVAVKVIKLGMDSKQVLARFEVEFQALSMMNHPNIARVLDAGSTERGQPYFVMELVTGESITAFCDRHCLGIDERIELLVQVCNGVQHAHHRGIMHRDLKPSNIFVAMVDDKPTVKIIDFGLARAVDHRLGQKTLHTERGVLLGTPRYMSPEQVESGSSGIDTRTDVYSLGVLLHELLVGRAPFDEDDERGGTARDIQQRLVEDTPTRPSARLVAGADTESVARHRSTAVRSLVQRLRGDLDWIVLKALERDRRRRYQTPTDLAADLERCLRDEPVLARPPSFGYRAGKVAKKYRVQLAALSVVCVALVAALVVWLEAHREMRLALTNYEQLLDSMRLRAFVRRADQELWPETPDMARAMRQWLDDVAAWKAGMRDHDQALEDLRRLRGRVVEGGAWRFEAMSDQFLNDHLAELVAGLRELDAPEGARSAVAARWQWASTVREKTVDAHQPAWDATIEAIRNEYGFQMPPQTGLIPLRRDPESKRFEFLFVRSGSRPAIDDRTGRLVMREGDGVVFVLIPAGEVVMGSQSTDSAGPNFYAQPQVNETPLMRGRLEAFFLSKYELTQDQWVRLTGAGNPSKYKGNSTGSERGTAFAREVGLTNPVENVSWTDAAEALRHHDLVLPTEAQWEYACRGGTGTPWWTGATRESLRAAGQGLVNIADGGRTDANGAAVQWQDAELWQEYEDQHLWHAPVGSYPPNRWGLHEVLGNVSEWCRDPYRLYDPDVPMGPDGAWVGDVEGDDLRVNRGGNYYRGVEWARAARRATPPADSRYENVGIRPARAIER